MGYDIFHFLERDCSIDIMLQGERYSLSRGGSHNSLGKGFQGRRRR